MMKFKVTYKRLKPAGAIQFDPNLEFVEVMEMPVNTPEDAIQHIAIHKSYLDVQRVEKVANEAKTDFHASSRAKSGIEDTAQVSTTRASYEYDVFICHASEDKDNFVRPLANNLIKQNLKIWYDEFELLLGDSLRRRIDYGLANSRYGVVVLSKNFFKREWPQKELDGLAAREDGRDKIILPIWHGVDKKYVASYSPTLADKVAVPTSDGMDRVVSEILLVVQKKETIGHNQSSDLGKVVEIFTRLNYERDLRQHIQYSRERWKQLVVQKLSHEKPSRYSKGVWTATYMITKDFQPPKLSDFLQILRSVQGHETGWPPWLAYHGGEFAPYPHNRLIECWLAKINSFNDRHSDFWVASPKGIMFLLRTYEEDFTEQLSPGTAFDVTLPIWRVGEYLLHAERLAKILGQDAAPIMFEFTWEGLSGRTLTSWAEPLRILYPGQRSRQDVVSSKTTVSADHISGNMPEIVLTLTKPLYEIFDFFEPPRQMIDEELLKMMKHK